MVQLFIKILLRVDAYLWKLRWLIKVKGGPKKKSMMNTWYMNKKYNPGVQQIVGHWKKGMTNTSDKNKKLNVGKTVQPILGSGTKVENDLSPNWLLTSILGIFNLIGYLFYTSTQSDWPQFLQKKIGLSLWLYHI